jgi:hypothetical protein
MWNKTNDELAEFVLCKELLEQIQKMDKIPSSTRDVVSKQRMVVELEAMKEKNLRQHYFFDQLLGVTLQSPDTEEGISPSLPLIYRSVLYDRDGNTFYS